MGHPRLNLPILLTRADLLWNKPSGKIIGTILKIDKGGTQTNGQKDKKIDDDAQGLTS